MIQFNPEIKVEDLLSHITYIHAPTQEIVYEILKALVENHIPEVLELKRILSLPDLALCTSQQQTEKLRAHIPGLMTKLLLFPIFQQEKMALTNYLNQKYARSPFTNILLDETETKENVSQTFMYESEIWQWMADHKEEHAHKSIILTCRRPAGSGRRYSTVIEVSGNDLIINSRVKPHFLPNQVIGRCKL